MSETPRDRLSEAAVDPAPDPLLDRTIDGKYKIEAAIGGGAMGTVYRARHVTLGALRAIKIMRADLATDPYFVERFQIEARLLEGLRHPHLVALYDFGRLPEGAWYIVSEFVEGQTLAAVLRSGTTVSPAAIARLFCEIIDGLALAHAKGVIHRDISPDNIMIAGDLESAKLLDFGIAKNVAGTSASLTGASFLLGKLGYAAPEQMGLLPRGEEIDGRADVFSLAAVLYRTLAGQLPWSHDSVPAYVHDLLIRPEARLDERLASDVPKAWRAVLRHSLARDRRRRTRDLGTFKRELLDAAARAGRGGPAPQPNRRRAGAAALAAIGVALSLWAALAWRSPRTASEPTPIPAPRTAAPTDRAPDAPVTPEAPARAPRTPPFPTARPRPAPTEPEAARAVGSAAAVATRDTQAEERPASPGTLVVRSTPEADILLDGEVRGRTPARLRVAPGRHTLTLTSAARQRVEEAVEVTAGATVERSLRFPGFGSLSVTSDVWIEVVIDGAPPQQTPFFLSRIDAGDHQLRATRPGFKDITIPFAIVEGETRQLRLTPERTH